MTPAHGTPNRRESDDANVHESRQLEWAAREIERLRVAMFHVVRDSPGTPDSVKKYLLRELEGAWGESYEEAMLRDQ